MMAAADELLECQLCRPSDGTDCRPVDPSRRGVSASRLLANAPDVAYSVTKGIVASAAYSVLTPIPVWRILVLFSNRERSERAVQAQLSPSYCILKSVYSYGQTGSVDKHFHREDLATPEGVKSDWP